MTWRRAFYDVRRARQAERALELPPPRRGIGRHVWTVGAVLLLLGAARMVAAAFGW